MESAARFINTLAWPTVFVAGCVTWYMTWDHEYLRPMLGGMKDYQGDFILGVAAGFLGFAAYSWARKHNKSKQIEATVTLGAMALVAGFIYAIETFHLWGSPQTLDMISPAIALIATAYNLNRFIISE